MLINPKIIIIPIIPDVKILEIKNKVDIPLKNTILMGKIAIWADIDTDSKVIIVLGIFFNLFESIIVIMLLKLIIPIVPANDNIKPISNIANGFFINIINNAIQTLFIVLLFLYNKPCYYCKYCHYACSFY